MLRMPLVMFCTVIFCTRGNDSDFLELGKEQNLRFFSSVYNLVGKIGKLGSNRRKNVPLPLPLNLVDLRRNFRFVV